MVKRARILRRAQEPSAETQEPSAETQENCDSPDAAVSADVIVNVEAPGAAGYVRHSIRTMVALSEVQIAQMTFAEYMYKVSTLLEQVTPYYTIAKAWQVKLNRAQYAEDIARAIAEWCEGCDELMSEMSGVLHCVEENHGDCDWRKTYARWLNRCVNAKKIGTCSGETCTSSHLASPTHRQWSLMQTDSSAWRKYRRSNLNRASA